MRIAQIGPADGAAPGAAESARALAEALERRGHQVTTVAIPDAESSREGVARSLLALAEVFAEGAAFDVIHNWAGHLALPLAALCQTPTLTTPPERLDEPAASAIYAHFLQLPLVSLCDAQRLSLLRARWLGSIPPAVDLERLVPRDDPGDYLAWYGEVSPEQRPDRAIDLALDLGLPLRLGGVVRPEDRAWFEVVIRRRCALGGAVEWVGELAAAEREELLRNALALIALPDRPEAFSYVAIEAMACGTPVVALRRGVWAEIVVDDLNGQLGATTRELHDALERIGDLRRAGCREEAERRFHPDSIAARYEAIYARLAATPQAEAALARVLGGEVVKLPARRS